MAYYRPKKVIASAAGRPGKDGLPGTGGPGGGALVIVSDTEPVTREDGTPLQQGDFWYHPTSEEFSLYIEGEGWTRVGGTLDTVHLSLANPTTTKMQQYADTVYPDDYPDISNRENQSQANEFFLDSDVYLLSRIISLENSVGGPGLLNYEAEAPITVNQEADKVTHGFDISTLPDYRAHNPLLDRKKSVRNLNNSATREGSFTFEAIAPVNVKQEDDKVIHGFRISDLNKI